MKVPWIQFLQIVLLSMKQLKWTLQTLLIIFHPQSTFVGFKTLQMWRHYKRSTLICSQIGPTLSTAKQMQPGLRARCEAEAGHSADTPLQLFVIACWLKGAFVLCWKGSVRVVGYFEAGCEASVPSVPQRLAAKGSLLKSMLVLSLQLVSQSELIILDYLWRPVS